MSELSVVWNAIRSLPREDRIQLVQAIWDDVAQEPRDLPLSDSEQQEIDRRLADVQQHPERLVPWDQVLARLQAKVRS